MKFTIAMPVLDGGKYIEAAIASIVSQTYPNWELVIVDAGSTDMTLDIVERFSKTDERVTLLSQPDCGVYAAIFEGFEHGDGDVLCWLNSDDIYPPWALNTVEQYFMKNAEAKWVNGLPGAWDKFGNLRYLLPIGAWPQKFIKNGYFHPEFLGCIQAESTFFHREVFDKLEKIERENIINSTLAGDYMLWRAFAVRTKLETIPTLLGGFRNHGENRSILEMGTYMDEVYATGVRRIPRRISLILAGFYQYIMSYSAYKNARKSSISINQENNTN